KELCDRDHRRLEVRLAEWGRQRDVQHAHPVVLAGPDPDVTLASWAGQARGQQVPREDPLHRVVRAYVEGHSDRVRIPGGVVETGHERDGPVLGNHESEPELTGDGSAAVNHRARPLPCRVPDCRASLKLRGPSPNDVWVPR